MSKRTALTSLSLVLLAALAVPACTVKNVEDAVGVDSQDLECRELSVSGTVDAKFDADLRVFMEASLDLERVSGEIKVAVRDACTRIALDLGAPDTFSNLGDEDAAITNGNRTGACDVAAARIEAIMTAHASANFSAQYIRGGCRQDYEEVKKCDQQCKEVETCEPGTVEERCTPGELSAVCQGKCKAQAECKGTADLPANCMGKCESECQGECKGTCTTRDGKKTENDPNCRGKCSASCNGKCRGLCKVEAPEGIECGADIRCKGGCEATYTAPACETHCTPPKCTVSTSCWESCTSRTEAKTVCEPSRLEIYADVSVHADVQKLVTTLNANLSVLAETADVKGKIAANACERLVTAGNAVVNGTSKVDVKAYSCAGAAAKKAAVSASRLQASVSGAAAVVGTCTSHAN